MTDQQHPAEPVIVHLPAEIDIANAEDVGQQLRAAFTRGAAVVIADLTSTIFCDSSRACQLVLSHNYADARDAQMRFVIPDRNMLRVLTVTGIDQLLPTYPNLDAAVSAGPVLDGTRHPGDHVQAASGPGHPPDRRRTSRGRSRSGVALAPSEGRAEGALLTAILLGSRLERREDGLRLQSAPAPTRCGAQLARSAAGGLVRADAAVAPLGLRRQAAPDARRFPGLTPASCPAGAASRWSQRCCAQRWFYVRWRPCPARSARP